MVRKFTTIFTLLKLVLIPSLTALELSHALFVGCMYKTFTLACSVQGKPLSCAKYVGNRYKSVMMLMMHDCCQNCAILTFVS